MNSTLPTIEIVTTSVALAGEQHARRMDAYDALTGGASIHVVWGSLMLTVDSVKQAAHLDMVLAQARVHAGRLPMHAPRPRGWLTQHSASPSTITTVRLWGEPAWAIAYVPAHTTPERRAVSTHVAVTFGPLTFRFLDQVAWRTTTAMTNKLATLAPNVLLR